MSTQAIHVDEGEFGVRLSSVSLSGVSVAIALLVALAPGAHGQAAPCTQIFIIPSPGAPASRGVACNEIDKLVPQLNTMLQRLIQMNATSEERMRDIERLLRNANAAGSRIEAKQVALAKSLAAKFSEASSQPDAAAMRSIRGLSDQLEEMFEKLTKANEDRSNAQAVQALRSAIEDAVAALDLVQLNKLINSIESLQRQLTGVEKKIDAIGESSDETRNATIFAEAMRAKSRGDLGQVRVLGALVRQGKTFERHDFSGVGLNGVQAPGLRADAANLMLTWIDDANLREARLQGARLVATKLARTDLEQADLRATAAAFAQADGARMQGADLSMATWFAADLRGADLRNAKLIGANFAHADLRNADMRGADLSGAFLGNADLRGAQLAGAVFRNTDVSFALLSNAALTAEQRSGTCATPAELQRWWIVESIPSSRFSGGYEHRRIVDSQLYLGRTGHRPYAACKPRDKTELASWNRPVYGNGPERWSDGFSFGVPHALLEGAGRRSELIERTQAALAAATERPKELRKLPQFAEIEARLQRALQERLGSLTRELVPRAPLIFDHDTAVLLMQKLKPDLLKQIGFDWRAASQGGLFEALGFDGQGNAKPWPRLFPDDFLNDDIEEVATRAFETWTRARSRALPLAEAQVRIQPHNLRAGAPWASVLVVDSRGGSADSSLPAHLGIDPAGFAFYPDGFVGYGFPTTPRIPIAFKVEGDAGAMRAAFDQAGVKPPELMTLRFKDVTLAAGAYGRQEFRFLLWTVEPVVRRQ